MHLQIIKYQCLNCSRTLFESNMDSTEQHVRDGKEPSIFLARPDLKDKPVIIKKCPRCGRYNEVVF